MPTIKPVSDLRSYTDVAEGSPVFLTKNGHGRYVLLDMKDYDRIKAGRRLLREVEAGRISGEEQGWVSAADVRAHFVARRDSAHECWYRLLH